MSKVGTLRLKGGDAEYEALRAALTNTVLTTLQIHGELSDACGEALGAALETNTALTTLHLDGKLSSAARELSVDFDMRRILRQ